LMKGAFYFQDFCLILFFWGFPYLCLTPLSYVVLSSLFHISLFKKSVLCFTLVFVEVLS
jgi:hypothetical protein